jgi:hypothetical protein
MSTTPRRGAWTWAATCAGLFFLLALVVAMPVQAHPALAAPAHAPSTARTRAVPDRSAVHHRTAPRAHATGTSLNRTASLAGQVWAPATQPLVERVGDRRFQALGASLPQRPSSRAPPR